MEETKTVKDYVIGGAGVLLFLIPEMIKMLVSLMYVFVIYAILKLDPSTFDKPMAALCIVALMICPLGAYYFYSKSVASELYEAAVKYLADNSSIFTHVKRTEEPQ